MDFVRVFTGEDGQSHFENVDPVAGSDWARGVEATQCSVRQMAVGTVMDWHPAPRSQLVIHLSGQLEIVLPDGEAHIFGPGSLRMMDDLTGRGHLTRVVGSEPVMQAVVLMPE